MATADDTTNDETAADADAKMNAIITARFKREAAAQKKAADELRAEIKAQHEAHAAEMKELLSGRSSAGSQQQETQGATQQPAQPSAEMRLMQEKMAKLERENADAKASALRVAERSNRDAARTRAAEQLTKKGLSPVRARAVLADMESQNHFRLNEAGEPVVTVKRVREKDGKPEPVDFDGYDALEEAIGDWAKTPDAAEFLPPPQNQQRTTTQTQPVRRVVGKGATGTVLDKTATQEEMTAVAEAELARIGGGR